MGGTRDRGAPAPQSAAKDDLESTSTPWFFSLTTLYKLITDPVYGEDCGICGRSKPKTHDQRSKHQSGRHHQTNPMPWEAPRSRPGPPVPEQPFVTADYSSDYSSYQARARASRPPPPARSVAHARQRGF